MIRCSSMHRFCVLIFRLTIEVLVLSVSTKESFEPLVTFSMVGSVIALF
jgi:hypothetical protein